VIYGSDKDVDIHTAILIKTIREEQAQKELERGSYLECFRGTDLQRTLTAVFLYTSQNWGGAAFLTQSICFLIIAGLPAIHAFDVSIGGFGLSLLIIIGSWFVTGYFRRRSAFILGCVINLIIMTIIGALYYAPGQTGLWAIAVLMYVTLSPGNAFYIYPLYIYFCTYLCFGTTPLSNCRLFPSL